jgi:hypothetical protein
MTTVKPILSKPIVAENTTSKDKIERANSAVKVDQHLAAAQQHLEAQSPEAGTQQAEVLDKLKEQRNAIQTNLSEYISYLEEEIATSNDSDDKSELNKQKREIEAHLNNPDKVAKELKDIVEMPSQQELATSLMDTTNEHINQVRAQRAELVNDIQAQGYVSPDDPKALELKQLDATYHQLRADRLKIADLSGDGNDDFAQELDRLLTIEDDMKANPNNNIYGSVETALTSLISLDAGDDATDRVTTLRELQERYENYNLTSAVKDVDDETSAQFAKDYNNPSNVTFTHVTAATSGEKKVGKHQDEKLKIAIPARYDEVDSQTGANSNTVVVKTDTGDLVRYKRENVNGQGFTTTMEYVTKNDAGEYVANPRKINEGRIFVENSEGKVAVISTQVAQTQYNYNPNLKSEFLTHGREAIDKLPPPSESPATSRVGATSTPSTAASPSSSASDEKSAVAVAKDVAVTAYRFGTPLGLAIEGVKATLHGVSIAPKVVEVMTDNENVGIFDALRVADAGKQAENTEAQKLKEQERAKQKAEQAEDKRKAQQEVDRLIEEAKREGTERAGS